MDRMQAVRRALTIAGSDSGGCAGIQADLKTFGALGVHGMSAVTAVTAQDTRCVHTAYHLPPRVVEMQIRVVVEDIGTDAVKTGMLASAEIVTLVAETLAEYRIQNLVVDPVMVSTGGDRLLREDAVDLLKKKLFPLAVVVTPNVWEAEVLTGGPIRTWEETREAASRILGWGPAAVVIKGGHSGESDDSVDTYFDGRQFRRFSAPRLPSRNTHGSGCTFAAAITAYLARGLGRIEAVEEAKKYVTEAIRHGLTLGHGHGPLGHFHQSWNPPGP